MGFKASCILIYHKRNKILYFYIFKVETCKNILLIFKCASYTLVELATCFILFFFFLPSSFICGVIVFFICQFVNLFVFGWLLGYLVYHCLSSIGLCVSDRAVQIMHQLLSILDLFCAIFINQQDRQKHSASECSQIRYLALALRSAEMSVSVNIRIIASDFY